MYFAMRGAAVLALILFVLSAGMAQTTAGKPPQASAPGPHDQHRSAMEACAKACSDCQRACDSCGTHCARLVASGKTDHFKSLQTCRDCATFCAAAAQMVAREGPFVDLMCKACAEACDRCGKECEQVPADAHMKQCAEECRKCAKACRDMLQHMKH